MKNRFVTLPSVLLTGLLIVGSAACVNAQSKNPEQAVRSVIDDLFDAMRAGNGDGVAAVFHESAGMSSVGSRNGEPFIHFSTPSDFVTSVSTPHDQAWDERIWDVDIKIDGNMASAWVPYAFYLGDSFSHCGTNSITLFNSTDGWKLTGLTDTRRQNDCGIPPEIAGQ